MGAWRLSGWRGSPSSLSAPSARHSRSGCSTAGESERIAFEHTDTELRSKETTMSDTTETAILAGGCFWGVQELLRRRDGVISTRVGYAGGENKNPTYGNHPGHAETVEIVFDPARISYRDIL